MMKKIIAIVMCIMLVCSVITTVSADETTEYITFDLRQAGANAKIFTDETTAQSIVTAMNNTEISANLSDEWNSQYLSVKQKVDGTNWVARITKTLDKTAFESKKDSDGYYYSATRKDNAFNYDKTTNIPFYISTDADKANGILLGGTSTSSEQTLTLNTDEKLSALYVAAVSTSDRTTTIKITYNDNTEFTPEVTTLKGDRYINHTDTKVEDTIWGSESAYLRGYTYSDSQYSTSISGAKYMYGITKVPVDASKTVEKISFKISDGYAATAVIGITGEIASTEEITVATIADLKTKYADVSAITISNYEDVRAILDTLNPEYIPAEDAKYIAALTNAVNGFVASIDGVISKYDYIDLSTVKNAPIAANVGDACTVRSFGHSATDYQYVMNIAAINNKKVKGYTFSDNNIPFDVSATNGNYGVRVSGVGETGINTTESVTLAEPARYNSLSIMGATGTNSSERNEIYVQVTYSDGTAKFTGATMKTQPAVKNSLDTSGITSGDQVSYVCDTNDKNNTAGTFLKSDNGYYANESYLNMYVPVYTVELDNTKEVVSIQIGCTLYWSSFTVLAMSGEKVTLADVIDSFETVTEENYKNIDDMIKSLSEGDLTPAQQAKLDLIKKQIKFYVQDYVPIEIPKNVFNAKVFGNNVSVSSVTNTDYISLDSNVGNSSILDAVTWEAEKKADGYIYSANDIPFDVNTEKGVLFGNISGDKVTIDVPDGKYDSISTLFAFSYIDAGAFTMKAIYDDGSFTLDSNWNPANYGHCNGNFETQTVNDGKEADSYVVISKGGTLRTTAADPNTYTTFSARYYFPVMTLDTDVEKTLVSIEFTNTRNDSNGAILGVTGSRNDSTNKTLTRVFNSLMKNFTDAELEAAHSAYVDSYDAGLYTNKTYGLEPMDVIYLKHSSDVLSGKVMSYVNTDNDYTVVAIVLNADGSFDRVEIMGQGTANLSAHDFSETIVLDEGQKINVLLWENFATLKPYMTAKEL